MKIRLLLFSVLFASLFTACEEDEQAAPSRTYQVNVYAGMPGIYGYADDSNNKTSLPLADVTVKIYPTEKDYLLSQNEIVQGFTDEEGKFSFEYDSLGSLWFEAYKDTLSNQRGISRYTYDSAIDHNEIIIAGWESKEYENYHSVFATLTNTPTKLRLLVYREGRPVEDAQVQLYFTEQAYQDSLAAQEDFELLKPTYGYPRAEASDPEGSFIYHNKDYFLQTTNEAGEVYFDNLEPRNYWFRITKDTLSNEGMIVRTREALPRNAETTTQMEIGIE